MSARVRYLATMNGRTVDEVVCVMAPLLVWSREGTSTSARLWWAILRGRPCAGWWMRLVSLCRAGRSARGVMARRVKGFLRGGLFGFHHYLFIHWFIFLSCICYLFYHVHSYFIEKVGFLFNNRLTGDNDSWVDILWYARHVLVDDVTHEKATPLATWLWQHRQNLGQSKWWFFFILFCFIEFVSLLLL